MKMLFLLSRGALVMLSACLALGCSKLVSSSTQTLPATASAANNVARLTGNVLARFLDPAPFPEPRPKAS